MLAVSHTHQDKKLNTTLLSILKLIVMWCYPDYSQKLDLLIYEAMGKYRLDQKMRIKKNP